jgi:hypothetical protein
VNFRNAGRLQYNPRTLPPTWLEPWRDNDSRKWTSENRSSHRRSEGYGATNASGYIVWADRVIPFKEEPESLVIGVFFTIPRDVVERGDLELIFRDFPPVKLVESRRKKTNPSQ